MASKLETTARQGFKNLNKFMLAIWRLGLGQWLNMWPQWLGRYMVLIHRGRKTGYRRQTPVNYAEIDGEIYCVAGFGAVADWYRNLRANPEVEVWLPDGWWAGRAEVLPPSPERLAIVRQVLIASGFAARLFEGIDPKTISAIELAHLIGWPEALPRGMSVAEPRTPYILIHIRREKERTGSGGPGDLAWLWPLATFLLLPLVLRRKK
jgi:deazaflavin-dependent oxidoreductase (nitroreductase family)